MRKRKLLKNTYAALINQFVTFICGFILPKQILIYFGSEANGLITSITQFLGIIALMDMGIGAVVQSNLYKPLADGDEVAINKIVTSARRFFNKIAIVMIIYTILLMLFYPTFIYKSLDFVSIDILIFAIFVSSMAQYLLGITNQMVLAADQKAYVYLLPSSIAVVLNTIMSVILIRNGATLNMVKLGSALILLLRPLAITIYVKKHYNINKKVDLKEEPIKQKWNAMAQHIATFVVDKTDVVVLTFLSTLKNVSIYYVYHLVVLGLCQIFAMLTTGIQSLFGDMYAKNEMEKLKKAYSVFEWIAHTMVSFLYGCAGVLMIPFVQVYTEGINDANYLNVHFSWLITIAFALYCLRTFYNILVKSVGHYKETQAYAVIEAILNVLISVILVWKLGLIGVAIGTLISVLYRAVSLMLYTNKNLIQRPKSIFFKQYFVDGLTFVLILFTTGSFKMEAVGYFEWGILAIKTGGVAALVVAIINVIFYKNMIVDVISMLYRKKI